MGSDTRRGVRKTALNLSCKKVVAVIHVSCYIYRMSALKKAVAASGGATELAKKLRVTPAAVSNWLMDGRKIPAHRVLDVEAASGVSRSELRPDLYPPEQVA